MAAIVFYKCNNCDFVARVFHSLGEGKESMLVGGGDGYSTYVCASCLKSVKIKAYDGNAMKCPHCGSEKLIGHNVKECPKCKTGILEEDRDNAVMF